MLRAVTERALFSLFEGDATILSMQRQNIELFGLLAGNTLSAAGADDHYAIGVLNSATLLVPP
jgi:hypothetical protein